MQVILQQAGTLSLYAAAMMQTAQPPQGLIGQVAGLLVGSIPTALLFVVLVLAYQFLVQGPLTVTLKERHALTEGAVEEAQKAIAQAEARAEEYAARLRQARADIYRIREQRIKQWNSERDAALDAARKDAGRKVSEAKTDLEAEAAAARQTILASAGELASQAVRAVLPLATGGSR
jgi:F-type H+-transporting ATPase subunit b